MRISYEHLHGGNIEVVSINGVEGVEGLDVVESEEASEDAESIEIELAIPPDNAAEEFRQWFHFALEGDIGATYTFHLRVDDTTYPDAWEEYDVCCSYNLETWFRVPCDFDEEFLSWDFVPEQPVAYFAYFAPYSRARHDELLEEIRETTHARVEVLGESVQGASMDLVIVGDESKDKLSIWVTARQHPGETMAEWFAEGLLTRLLHQQDDEDVANLLEKATIYVVPCMCPDGAALGNLRSNAVGVNLNRAWLEPSMEESPEVYLVREKMKETGVDLFIDVHGDERNPYCFLAGCEGNPGYGERLRNLEELFEQNLLANNADFQDQYGYDRDEPGGGDLSAAGNWAGETFDCLSWTLEMPFKDAANNPDSELGFSTDRAEALGASVVETMLEVVDDLRE